MAQAARVICRSEALAEGGKGVRFKLRRFGIEASAFAVRYQGKVFAYLNSCAHIPVELDWLEGEFFDKSGLYLICATHGATFEPDSGRCVMGPCRGQSLVALLVEERGGNVYLTEDGKHHG